MSDTKILQAIVDGQASIREEIRDMEKRLTKKIDHVAEGVDKNGERIDKLGKQLAYLEDDAPTVREFHRLEKRVVKLEEQLSKN